MPAGSADFFPGLGGGGGFPARFAKPILFSFCSMSLSGLQRPCPGVLAPGQAPGERHWPGLRVEALAEPHGVTEDLRSICQRTAETDRSELEDLGEVGSYEFWGSVSTREKYGVIP